MSFRGKGVIKKIYATLSRSYLYIRHNRKKRLLNSHKHTMKTERKNHYEKKLTAIALCAVTALSFTAFSNNVPAKNNIKQRDDQVIKGDNLKIPNPFTDCKAITDVQILAGFTPLIPTSIPADYSQDKIQTVKDEMVQIIYSNGENKITFRQGKGSEDISGDYNQYAESSTMAVGSLTVSTKGCNGKVNIAAWTNGKYTFAISANPGGEGLDNKVISDMISSIKAESDIDETVQIPNPFKDFQSIGDAEKMAGFTLTLPEKKCRKVMYRSPSKPLQVI